MSATPAKPAVLERLEKAKADREARTPDVLKAELDSRMIGAEARHAATIDAIKKEAGEEVTKAKAVAAAHPAAAAAAPAAEGKAE